MKKFQPLIIGFSLVALGVSCVDENTKPPTPSEEARQYTIALTGINAQVAPGATGTGEINIVGDEFKTTINVTGAPASLHVQNIHIGTRCPAMTDDTNGDGFIDYNEALVATNKIIIPLDDDLKTQSEGTQNMSGANYAYEQTASYLALLGDLHLGDPDTNDDVIKLDPDAGLDLNGKVVMIQGVPVATQLPGTVTGAKSRTPQDSLPILCGVITQTTGGTTTGGTTTGGTTTGGTTTGGTTTGGTTTGGTTTGGTTTGGTTTGGTTTGGTTTGGTTTGGTTTGGTTTGGTTGTTTGP